MRGEPSVDLPATAFVNFVQNHDQIGNRAFGDRISAIAPPEAVWAATAILLLAPSPPLLFMGQEWAAPQPFLFFCNFGEELSDAVREGRRKEFSAFPEFRDPAARSRIPDPNDQNTATSAIAQAFKRACVKFGLGAYLYRLPKTWAEYDQQRPDFTQEAKARLQRLAGGNGG